MASQRMPSEDSCTFERVRLQSSELRREERSGPHQGREGRAYDPVTVRTLDGVRIALPTVWKRWQERPALTAAICSRARSCAESRIVVPTFPKLAELSCRGRPRTVSVASSPEGPVRRRSSARRGCHLPPGPPVGCGGRRSPERRSRQLSVTMSARVESHLSRRRARCHPRRRWRGRRWWRSPGRDLPRCSAVLAPQRE